MCICVYVYVYVARDTYTSDIVGEFGQGGEKSKDTALFLTYSV